MPNDINSGQVVEVDDICLGLGSFLEFGLGVKCCTWHNLFECHGDGSEPSYAYGTCVSIMLKELSKNSYLLPPWCPPGKLQRQMRLEEVQLRAYWQQRWVRQAVMPVQLGMVDHCPQCTRK